MISGNTVSVTTLIEEIKSEQRVQTGSWRKISELLNQADVEFGFGTDEMKQILDQTDISTSKARNEKWILQRHHYKTPAQFRRDIMDNREMAA